MPNQTPEVLIQFLSSIAVGIFLVGFIVTIFLLHQKRKLLQEKELAQVKAGFEKQLLETKLEIQESVLTHISQEIHDNIGQVLLLVNVNNSILQSMGQTQQSNTILSENKALVSKAMEDISDLSRTLHSDRIADMGVFAAIYQELSLLAQKNLFTIDLENLLPATGKTISREANIVVFRLYQEIIKNIIKHAAATNIRVGISQDADFLILTISDNGKGFDQGKPSADSGVGLRSLKQRIGLIDGKISIDSMPGEGTTVRIFIPKPQNSL